MPEVGEERGALHSDKEDEPIIAETCVDESDEREKALSRLVIVINKLELDKLDDQVFWEDYCLPWIRLCQPIQRNGDLLDISEKPDFNNAQVCELLVNPVWFDSTKAKGNSYDQPTIRTVCRAGRKLKKECKRRAKSAVPRR